MVQLITVNMVKGSSHSSVYEVKTTICPTGELEHHKPPLPTWFHISNIFSEGLSDNIIADIMSGPQQTACLAKGYSGQKMALSRELIFAESMP